MIDPAAVLPRAQQIPRYTIHGRYGGFIRYDDHPSGDWVKWGEVEPIIRDLVAGLTDLQGEKERLTSEWSKWRLLARFCT